MNEEARIEAARIRHAKSERLFFRLMIASVLVFLGFVVLILLGVFR